MLLLGLLCIGLGIYAVASESLSLAETDAGTVIAINVGTAGNTVNREGVGLADALRAALVGGSSFVLSLVMSIIFFRFFKPLADSQMLFFFLFFFSLSFELIKPLSFLTKIFILPESLSLFLSQVSFFGYLIGLFSMFLVSLYQIKYRHQGIAMMFVIIVSTVLTVLVPMDTSTFHNFIYSPIYRSEVLRMAQGIIIVTVAGYVIHKGRENLVRMLSVFFMMTGHSLVHFTLDPAILISGETMLFCGVIIYVIQLFRAYFWY